MQSDCQIQYEETTYKANARQSQIEGKKIRLNIMKLETWGARAQHSS